MSFRPIIHRFTGTSSGGHCRCIAVFPPHRPTLSPWHVHYNYATTHLQSQRQQSSNANSRRGQKSGKGYSEKSTVAITRNPKTTPNLLRLSAYVGAGLVAASLGLYHITIPAPLDVAAVPDSENAERSKTGLPRFSLEEIRKHNSGSPNPWVIHGNKVYDITDWVSAHPGGDVILRAAGGSIDGYWDIFSIHKNQYVYEILDTYLIGYVDKVDLSLDGSRLAVAHDIEDPFSDDPVRHPDLITRTRKPRNAESPACSIEDNFLTPNDLFYVRNHMWVPTVDQDPDDHRLTIELADGSTKSYTLRELKARFPKRTVTATLQCSGNRRAHMSEGSGRKANGLPWDVGAISNAVWEGVMLADILADAGFDPRSSQKDKDVKHVHFVGMETYGSSIPIRKAMDPYGDVLLAWGMNGEPLPRDHGFPLRSIVPGNVAARSVKWLQRIALSDDESPAQWQRRDYKCFGPNQTAVDWDSAPAIQEMPVQSAITGVRLGHMRSNGKDDNGNAVKGHPISMSGYAFSGGGHGIVRVDVSLDNGHTWFQARLLDDGSDDGDDGHSNVVTNQPGQSWSWKRWRFDGTVPQVTFHDSQDGRKCTHLVVKAIDDAYNTQPESYAATWNIRGNLTSAWHRLLVCTDCSSKS